MATVMEMRWPGISTTEYEEARRKVKWEEDHPEGGLFHVAWQDGDALRVIDVWESEEQFNRFAESRLMPVVKGEMGIESDPEVAFFEAYAVFNPSALARA